MLLLGVILGFTGKLFIAPQIAFIKASATESVVSGKELAKQFFSDVKYDGRMIENDETSPIRYVSGDWVVVTDAEGKKVLSISLSPEAAKHVEDHQGSVLSEDAITKKAEAELAKYVDVKYHLNSEVERDDTFYKLNIKETYSGIDSGLNGYLVYYPDGTLFSISFNPRSIEDFNQTLISKEEAYRIAVEAITKDREDWEVEDQYSEDAIELVTAQVGQVYHVEVYGNKNGMHLYGSCSLYATTGEVIELCYEDR